MSFEDAHEQIVRRRRRIALVWDLAADEIGARDKPVEQVMRRSIGLPPVHAPDVSNSDFRVLPAVP